MRGIPNQDTLETIFPPIADYAFLSDCENSADRAHWRGEWFCTSRAPQPERLWHHPRSSGGSFRLAPVDSAVPAHRQYEPGTMVLATTWQTRSGWLIVNDFLAVAPWYRTGERSSHHKRTPGDFDARHVLVRTATCLHGSVDILLNCEPSFDYGRVDAEWEYEGSAYHQVKTTNKEFPGLTLTGDMRFGIEGRAVRARHRLTEGETSFVVLSWSDAPPPTSRAEVDTCRAETSRFWRTGSTVGAFPIIRGESSSSAARSP